MLKAIKIGGRESVWYTHPRPDHNPVMRGNTAMATYQPSTNSRRFFVSPIIDGKKQCKHCEEWIHLDQFRLVKDNRVNKDYHYHLCADCERKAMAIRARRRTRDSRIEERRKQAEKKGRIYNERKFRPTSDLYSESLVARNARDAFNWWFEKKTQEEKDAWYEASGKPWNNPKLNSAEKFKVRYRLDNEFNAYQRTRRQLKKELYKDGVSDIIRSSINRGGKSRKIENMLGYTINELIDHLEKQFTKGMTWDKFKNGEIHIDHIIPKAAFELTDDNEWRTCWGLPNLRPLWAKDNIAKSAKVMTLL